MPHISMFKLLHCPNQTVDFVFRDTDICG